MSHINKFFEKALFALSNKKVKCILYNRVIYNSTSCPGRNLKSKNRIRINSHIGTTKVPNLKSKILQNCILDEEHRTDLNQTKYVCVQYIIKSGI